MDIQLRAWERWDVVQRATSDPITMNSNGVECSALPIK